MPPISRQLAAIALCLMFLPQAHAETFTGRVAAIVDGDTVDVLVDKATRRVRLAGIDAPERAQAFGARAKQKLADLVGGQVVQVEWNKTDRYERTVGKITLGDLDANLAMVADGLAWWYRKYANEQPPADRLLCEAAEARAQTAHRGLWRDPDPMPPWEFRGNYGDSLLNTVITVAFNAHSHSVHLVNCHRNFPVDRSVLLDQGDPDARVHIGQLHSDSRNPRTSSSISR